MRGTLQSNQTSLHLAQKQLGNYYMGIRTNQSCLPMDVCNMPYITLLSITTMNVYPTRILVLFSPIIMIYHPLIPLY